MPVSNVLSKATSFAEVPDIRSIEDTKVLSSLVVKDKLLNQYVLAEPAKNWLFKLSDIPVIGIEAGGSGAFGFSKSSNIKMKLQADGLLLEVMEHWMGLLFVGLQTKTTQEYIDNVEAPRKHVPVKKQKDGNLTMSVKITSGTTIAFESPVPGKENEPSTSGFIQDFQSDLYIDKKADLYIAVNGVWNTQGCYGLKMSIVRAEIKNKLF